MANDPRYSKLTGDSLALDTANLKGMLEDQVNNPRRGKTPWQLDRPSKRVLNCPVTMWIYNVSPRTHQISSLPGMPRILPSAKEGEAYGAPLAIKEVTLDYASRGDYKLQAIEVDDDDLAGNIVCPTCQGNGANCSDSGDLRMWGVFASRNNPPTAEELATANRRLSETFSNLVKIADTLYEDPKRRWQVSGTNGEVYRMAAKAKKIQRPWCTVLADMVACPGCGQTNATGAMVCSSTTCGIILDYDKALKYRKITKEEYDAAVADGLVPVATSF